MLKTEIYQQIYVAKEKEVSQVISFFLNRSYVKREEILQIVLRVQKQKIKEINKENKMLMLARRPTRRTIIDLIKKEAILEYFRERGEVWIEQEELRAWYYKKFLGHLREGHSKCCSFGREMRLFGRVTVCCGNPRKWYATFPELLKEEEEKNEGQSELTRRSKRRKIPNRVFKTFA